MVRRERIPRAEPQPPNSHDETHVSDEKRWTEQSLREMAKKSGKQEHEYLAHGGDQVVLQVRETREGKPEGIRKNSVIKVTQRFVSEGIVKEIIRNADDKALEKLDPRLQRRVEKALGEEEEQRAQASEAGEVYDPNAELRQEVDRAKEYERTLRQYFPPENILRSRVYLRKVPISKGAAQEVLKRYGYEKLGMKGDLEIPTMIRVQSRIPREIADLPNGISSVSFSYMEGILNMMPEEEDRMERMGFDETVELDMAFLENILDQGTISLLTETRSDRELKTVMQDFVERTIKLANEGGEMIDIAGGGNVKFYKDDNNDWKYLIIDPDAHRDWGKLKDNLHALMQETNQEAMRELRFDESGTKEELRQKKSAHREKMHERYEMTVNGVNFARTMNILAKALEIPDRVDILSEVGALRSKYEVLMEVHRYNQGTFRGKRRRMKRFTGEGGRMREQSTEPETFVPEGETIVRGRPTEIVANLDESESHTIDPDLWVIEGDVDIDEDTEEVVATPREIGMVPGDVLLEEMDTDKNDTIWDY